MAIPIAFILILSPLSFALNGIRTFYNIEQKKGMVVLIVEVLWLFQIFYNFFKVPSDLKKKPYFERAYIRWVNNRSKTNSYPAEDESILRKIARRYLCTHFLFDFLSSVPPLVISLTVSQDTDWMFAIEAFHMLRIFRLEQIILPLQIALLYFVHEKKRQKAVIQGTNAFIGIILLIHYATCAWIYVGRMHNNAESLIPN